MSTTPSKSEYVYVASSWRTAAQPAVVQILRAAGIGKRTAILTQDGEEPELMAKMVDHIATSVFDLLGWLGVED